MTNHIESLKVFIGALGSDVEREAFAFRCGTTFGHLRQIYYGNRACDIGLAIEIEKNSDQQVLCEQMRPDVDFNYLRTSIKNKDVEHG